MSAFTPGPWTVCYTGSINMVVPAMRDGMIADLIDSEANARLIAAAPDLLEAVQFLRRHLGLFIGPYDEIGNAILAVACAAIVRATGEAT